MSASGRIELLGVSSSNGRNGWFSAGPLSGPAPIDPGHLKTAWPDWASNGRKEAWIPLELAAPESILEVTRCDQESNSSADGTHWKVFQSRVRQKTQGLNAS